MTPTLKLAMPILVKVGELLFKTKKKMGPTLNLDEEKQSALVIVEEEAPVPLLESYPQKGKVHVFIHQVWKQQVQKIQNGKRRESLHTRCAERARAFHWGCVEEEEAGSQALVKSKK